MSHMLHVTHVNIRNSHVSHIQLADLSGPTWSGFFLTLSLEPLSPWWPNLCVEVQSVMTDYILRRRPHFLISPSQEWHMDDGRAYVLWEEKIREQNTCKTDLNRIMTERPNIFYIFEKLSVQDVKHDIPMCQGHSTRPQPIQFGPSPFNSAPQCKKSSLRYQFGRNSWKLGSQRLLHHGHFWWCSNFFSSPCQVVPGACLSQIVTNVWSWN